VEDDAWIRRCRSCWRRAVRTAGQRQTAPASGRLPSCGSASAESDLHVAPVPPSPTCISVDLPRSASLCPASLHDPLPPIPMKPTPKYSFHLAPLLAGLMFLHSYSCVLCASSVEEDVRHLFSSCLFSDACWTYLGVILGSFPGLSVNGASS
jgi:hypothetical protein